MNPSAYEMWARSLDTKAIVALSDERLILRLRGGIEEYQRRVYSPSLEGLERWNGLNITIPELKRRGLFYSTLVTFRLAGIPIPEPEPKKPQPHE